MRRDYSWKNRIRWCKDNSLRICHLTQQVIQASQLNFLSSLHLFHRLDVSRHLTTHRICKRVHPKFLSVLTITSLESSLALVVIWTWVRPDLWTSMDHSIQSINLMRLILTSMGRLPLHKTKLWFNQTITVRHLEFWITPSSLTTWTSRRILPLS